MEIMPPMRIHLLRTIASLIRIICLTGVSANAATIAISDVVQVLSNYQNPPDLRLRNSVENNFVLPSGLKSSLQVNASSINSGQGGDGLDSLMSGMSL